MGGWVRMIDGDVIYLVFYLFDEIYLFLCIEVCFLRRLRLKGKRLWLVLLFLVCYFYNSLFIYYWFL